MGRRASALISATTGLLVPAAACGGSFETTPWNRVSGPAEGTAFVVELTGGPCDEDAFVEIEESAAEVVVEAQLQSDGYCTNDEDIGVPFTATFELNEPLGDRPLVDPACSTESGQIFVVCSESEQERKAQPAP